MQSRDANILVPIVKVVDGLNVLVVSRIQSMKSGKGASVTNIWLSQLPNAAHASSKVRSQADKVKTQLLSTLVRRPVFDRTSKAVIGAAASKVKKVPLCRASPAENAARWKKADLVKQHQRSATGRTAGQGRKRVSGVCQGSS